MDCVGDTVVILLEARSRSARTEAEARPEWSGRAAAAARSQRITIAEPVDAAAAMAAQQALRAGSARSAPPVPLLLLLACIARGSAADLSLLAIGDWGHDTAGQTACGASMGLIAARTEVPRTRLRTDDSAAPWRVVAFHTAKGDGEYNSTADAWRTWNWERITTVVNYGSVVDPALLRRARSHNVTVLGNGCPACPRGWGRSAEQLTNATARSLVIQSMVEFAVDNSLQGVNLDIEGNPNGTAAGLTSFVCELRRELRAQLPGAQLVFDAPSLPTCYHSPRCNATIPDVEDVSAASLFSARKASKKLLRNSTTAVSTSPRLAHASTSSPPWITI